MGRRMLALAKETRRLKLVLPLLVALFALFALPNPVHSQSNAPPAFPFATAVRSLPENSDPSLLIGFPIVATDPDSRDTLTYSLSGIDASLFNIGSTTGQLEAVQALDYESGSSYSVTVQATDSAGLYDSVSVSIEVTNVEETGEIILSRIAGTATPELHAALIDPDGNISEISWQWAVSIDKADWKDIPWARAESYAPSPEELRQFLRVQARYTDGHGPGKVAGTLFDTDLWSPEINHLPEFPFSESGVRTIGADAPAGQLIGQPVLASDLDRDVLTYWLSGDASQFFAIGADTGQLKTKSSLGSQFEGKHFGIVHVLDGRGGSASKTVRIDVGNVNPPAAPALGTEETAPEPEAPSVTDLSPNQAVASTTIQLEPPQMSAAAAEPASKPDTAAEPEPFLGQSMREGPSSTPAPVSQAKNEPADGPNQGLEDDHDGVPAIAAVQPPPVPLAEAGAPGNAVDPAGGRGAEAGSGGAGFGSPFTWLALVFLALILLAGTLVFLSKKRQGKESDILLPPPTVGPERRIGPLPVLFSQTDADAGANVRTGLLNSRVAEKS